MDTVKHSRKDGVIVVDIGSLRMTVDLRVPGFGFASVYTKGDIADLPERITSRMWVDGESQTRRVYQQANRYARIFSNPESMSKALTWGWW